uniref:Uncharacterized protein n=1 Tax=Molossus molossus TaxID=27622 RepID=A0A7J8DQ69_MOLMO|nr:hypothetical protein HJG59_009283 [Molossus molossus]
MAPQGDYAKASVSPQVSGLSHSMELAFEESVRGGLGSLTREETHTFTGRTAHVGRQPAHSALLCSSGEFTAAETVQHTAVSGSASCEHAEGTPEPCLSTVWGTGWRRPEATMGCIWPCFLATCVQHRQSFIAPW